MLGSLDREIAANGTSEVNKYIYKAFGEIASESSVSVATNWRYLGQWGYYYDRITPTMPTYVRARYLQTSFGRWMSQDPVGQLALYIYVLNSPTTLVDSSGLSPCFITLYGGHNFSVAAGIDDDYPNGIPPTDCVQGVACAAPNPGKKKGMPISQWVCSEYPCNSFPIPGNTDIDNPLMGLTPTNACNRMKTALTSAKQAAKKLLAGIHPNPAQKKCPPPDCDSVTIIVKCDPDMTKLFTSGKWKNLPKPIGENYWKACQNVCDSFQSMGPESSL